MRQRGLAVQALDLPEQHDTLHGIKAPVECAALFGHETAGRADCAGVPTGANCITR